jgi:hypothetical protein
LFLRLGVPALWFVLLPYAVLVVQRVFPPERVLLYKAFFFFILVGLVLEWARQRWPVGMYRRAWRGLAVLAVAFASFETWYVVRVNPGARGTNAAYQSGLDWLARQPPGPALIPEPTHNLFFRFYAHTRHPGFPWHIDDAKQDSVRYAYVVAFPNKRGLFQPPISFPPAFRNAEVEIFVMPRPVAPSSDEPKKRALLP